MKTNIEFTLTSCRDNVLQHTLSNSKAISHLFEHLLKCSLPTDISKVNISSFYFHFPRTIYMYSRQKA